MNSWESVDRKTLENAEAQWPLERQKLRRAVYKVIRELKIQEEHKKYSYLESSLKPWVAGAKEFSYPHIVYKTKIAISSNIWDDPLVIAASYRKHTKERKSWGRKQWNDFSEEMRNSEVPGVLRELFLCSLFNRADTFRIRKFWDSYVEIADKKRKGLPGGDEGWDIIASPKGRAKDFYLIDAKPLNDKSGINIGNLNKDGTPKQRDVLIAPVEAKWNGDILEMEFEFLLDAEKFWNVTDAHCDSQVRLKQKNGRYVERNRWKNNTQLDLNPRFSPLLKDWPVLPLEPLDIGDITEECLNEGIKVGGSKYQVRNLYEPEHWQ